jgi:hypothetical protein
VSGIELVRKPEAILILQKWTRISCRTAHELLSRRMDQPLPAGDRLRLWFHLRACQLCSRVERQMGLMRAAMRRIDK